MAQDRRIPQQEGTLHPSAVALAMRVLPVHVLYARRLMLHARLLALSKQILKSTIAFQPRELALRATTNAAENPEKGNVRCNQLMHWCLDARTGVALYKLVV